MTKAWKRTQCGKNHATSKLYSIVGRSGRQSDRSIDPTAQMGEIDDLLHKFLSQKNKSVFNCQ